MEELDRGSLHPRDGIGSPGWRSTKELASLISIWLFTISIWLPVCMTPIHFTESWSSHIGIQVSLIFLSPEKQNMWILTSSHRGHHYGGAWPRFSSSSVRIPEDKHIAPDKIRTHAPWRDSVGYPGWRSTKELDSQLSILLFGTDLQCKGFFLVYLCKFVSANQFE